MNVNLISAYNNPYARGLEERLAGNGISIKSNENEHLVKANAPAKLEAADDVLTKKERTFFKKLFPESSEQIDKHVLFNRNGRVQTPSVNKGVIFDGRA